MKTVRILLMVTLLQCSYSLWSQPEEQADTVYRRTLDLQLNTLGLFNGKYAGYLGWNFQNRNSFGVHIGLESYNAEYGMLREGYYFAPEFRWYLQSDPGVDCNGFFVAPYVKYNVGADIGRLQSINDDEYIDFSYDYTRAAVGLNTGLVNLPYKRFVFSIWGGVGWFAYRDEVFSNGMQADKMDYKFNDLFDARLEVSLGLRL